MRVAGWLQWIEVGEWGVAVNTSELDPPASLVTHIGCCCIRLVQRLPAILWIFAFQIYEKAARLSLYYCKCFPIFLRPVLVFQDELKIVVVGICGLLGLLCITDRSFVQGRPQSIAHYQGQVGIHFTFTFLF